MSEPRPGSLVGTPLNLAVAVAAVLALTVALTPPPAGRAALVAVAIAGLCVAAVLDRRRERQRQRELDALALVVVDGPVPNGVAGLIAAAEQSRTDVRATIGGLELERNGLIDALARTQARLRDPVVDARRERLAAVENVRVEVTVGSAAAPARLVDLWLDHGAIAVEPDIAARLVPGLPIGMRVLIGDDLVVPADVLAVAPGGGPRGGPGGEVEWTVRFGEPLRASALPPALWQVISMRRTRRVIPTGDVPVTGTLLTPFGEVAATVADLSDVGVGLVVALKGRQLGDLYHGLHVRITFPLLGRTAVLPVALRNVTCVGAEARLGLSFANERSAERTRLAEWLATRPEAEAA